MPNAQQFGLTCSGNWGFGGVWLAKRLDTKEDTVANIDKDFLLSLTVDQLVGVWTLFSGLTRNLTTHPSCPAPSCFGAGFVARTHQSRARHWERGRTRTHELPKIRTILVHTCPTTCCSISRGLVVRAAVGTGCAGLRRPVHHIVTRVTSLKLLLSYDERIDTDIRDRVLEILVPLLELDSPRMAARLGCRTRLMDELVPILTTKVGRNEASMLAAQLFREISKSPDNRLGLLYVQGRLVELASRDPPVSQLVWNHLYVLASMSDEAEESSNGEEDDDEEQEDKAGGMTRDVRNFSDNKSSHAV